VPAYLITQRGPEIGRRYELTGGQFTIGRGTDNDLVLPDGLVSRYHGVIRQEGADMVLIDLGSTNAAIVNDAPLEPGVPHRLQHRDVVTVGQSVFSFQNTTAAGATPSLSLPPSGEPRTLVGGFSPRAPLAEPTAPAPAAPAPAAPAQLAAFTPAEPMVPAAEPPETATVVSRGRGPAPEPAAPPPPEAAPPEPQDEPRTVISRPRAAAPEPAAPPEAPEPEPAPLDEPRTVITRKAPGAVPPPPGPAAVEPPPEEEGRTVITRRPGNVGGPPAGEPPPEEEGRTVITRRPSGSDETPTRQPPHRPG
jgi:predicted component of type VI protein secretion system